MSRVDFLIGKESSIVRNWRYSSNIRICYKRNKTAILRTLSIASEPLD